MIESPLIKDVMTASPHSVGDDLPLNKAIEMMREHHIRHLPVQSGGKLVGVLTDRDVKLALSVHPAAKDLLVSDIMTEDPYAVSPNTSLDKVLPVMANHKYGCVIVQGDKGRAIGIFTATDAVRMLGEVLNGKNPAVAGAF